MDDKIDDIAINNNTTERYLAIFAWIVIFFVPTIAFVEIPRYNYLESTFLWPWMILVNNTPTPDVFNFKTDQINVIGFPWSVFLFIPFFYALKSSFDLYQGAEDRISNGLTVIIAAIIQLGLIGMTFASQTIGVNEERTVFYLPQLLIIFVFGGFVFKWYYEKAKASLENPKVE